MLDKRGASRFDGQLLYFALSDWLSEFQHAVASGKTQSSGCSNGMEERWVSVEYSVGDHVVMLIIWAEIGADGVPFPVAARFEGKRDEVWKQLSAWRQAKGQGW